MPVEVEYNDNVISTGIFKKPIDSSVLVDHHGLAGDQQVDLKNHGGEHKAVYGFSEQHYDHWREALNKPELSFGQFGENLTISELDETSLCIGDQLQIGDCILEITQPRVPCFKLGIALERDNMPKLFVQHGNTGIYFRVLQSGTIKEADLVELNYQHPDKLSLYALFNAYFDKNFVNANEVMELATKIPQLSNEWHEKVIARLE